jgi:hypothetical protein
MLQQTGKINRLSADSSGCGLVSGLSKKAWKLMVTSSLVW